MQRAAVLNRYLSTWGGGERVTYAVANQLAARGYQVDVVTDEKVIPSMEEVARAFGPGHDRFNIRRVEREEDIRHALLDYTLLVNQCAGSSLVNPCPVGVYFVMFPFQLEGAFLGSYDHFVCNSKFTEYYTRLRWGHELATEVIYPGAELNPRRAQNKEKLIMTVGRFNVGGHSKNQAALIDAFVKMLPRLPSGWSLSVLGRVNPGPETALYIAELQKRCEGLPVRFHFNATEDEKADLLERASIYWHATGYGRQEPHEAHAFEHFGIAVVEAMAAGAVPICSRGGGPEEIIEYGTNGWLFEDEQELGAFTRLVACDSNRREAMQAAARQRAQYFSRAAFDSRFQSFLAAVCP